MSDEMPIPRGTLHDLNLLPGEEEDSDVFQTNTVLAPVTPGKTPETECGQGSESSVAVGGTEKDSASAAVSTTAVTTDVETPQPQKPKRRKYRPRVITESKPRVRKETPKPAPPPPPTTETGKRKYVRKTPPTEPSEKSRGKRRNITKEAVEPTVEASTSSQASCKRSLNFVNIQEQTNVEAEDVRGRCPSKLTVTLGRGIEIMVEPTCDFNNSIDQMQQQYNQMRQQYEVLQRAANEPIAPKNNPQKRKRGKHVTSQNAHQRSTDMVLYTSPHLKTNATNWEDRKSMAIQVKENREAWTQQPSTQQQDVCSTSTSCLTFSARQEKTGAPGRKGQSSGSALTEVKGSSTRKRSRTPTRPRDVASLIIARGEDNTAASNTHHAFGGALAAEMHNQMPKKKRTKRSVPNNGKIMLHNPNQIPPTGTYSEELWMTYLSVVEKLERLDINREQNALVPYNTTTTTTTREQQNALVARRREGTIVPLKPIKKKPIRAQVVEDEETIRVFNLLIKNIDSEGIDGTDDGTRRWWTNERELFRTRASSFIARMHEVQGDRRFTQWKGSVVDSVIGVFLTQNVSDHLSSSAFMSMAARFPLESTSHEAVRESEPIVCVPDLEDAISDFQYSEPDSEREADNSHECSTVSSQNSVVSSQNSTQSPTHQTADLLSDIGGQKDSLLNNSNTFMELLMMVGRNELCEVPRIVNDLSIVEKNMTSPNLSLGRQDVAESSSRQINVLEKDSQAEHGLREMDQQKSIATAKRKAKSRRVGDEIRADIDWTALRKEVESNVGKREKTADTMDSVDWEAVRCANVNEVAETIKARGMNNILAGRMQEFLNRVVGEHGSIDLEWLRDIPPDKAKEYLLSMNGLGLKSVECVRLLTLHHLAFPVDTNVGRIAVRLGWVPLHPMPDEARMHLLELYPVMESVQRYLWPRLCKLDQKTLYELHYQMITFGKVFCTKRNPNCLACPMKGDCRHFASAVATDRLLPWHEEPMSASGKQGGQSIVSASGQQGGQSIVSASQSRRIGPNPAVMVHPPYLQISETRHEVKNCEPIVEEPASPEQTAEPDCTHMMETDIEDTFCEDAEEIPTIKINELEKNLASFMKNNIGNMGILGAEWSKAIVALTEEAKIPMPKLKNVSRLRTEHQVYVLPDSHPLLRKMDRRQPDDPSPYLLAIWTPGEKADSIQPPESTCSLQEHGKLCDETTCFSCNSIRESNSQIVRGTLLIPCRTAMRGSFPLNGTYFQVNEVFADHETSLNPIEVPRSLLWNLERRTVYFGTSVSTIFKGLSKRSITDCFWHGYVCVRGFDQKTRAPRPLQKRLHVADSQLKQEKKYDRKE
ncbi:DNA glycosylase/AP lyase ROS1-like isoform X2 [Euphorbia lathyris]|uniref:DNA glycosylase/AP lyase ROS1-like isoform X2 n=1 Tax=Euphorbia lathyris TaxID=212925 RepID=UPI0033144174